MCTQVVPQVEAVQVRLVRKPLELLQHHPAQPDQPHAHVQSQEPFAEIVFYSLFTFVHSRLSNSVFIENLGLIFLPQ